MRKVNVIGIDIGATEIKYGIISFDGKNYFVESSFTTQTPTGENKVRKLSKIIFNIYKQLKKNFHSINAIGIGIAGLVNAECGEIVFSPNLYLKNINLRKIISRKIKLPIFVDNDANIATVGIHKYELKHKYKNLVCLTLGTGIGGGIIINDKIYHGSNGIAGELGHITLFPDGKKCNCGNFGCVERYLGSKWFIERVVEKLQQCKFNTNIYQLTDGDLSKLTGYLLFIAAEKNDAFAKKQWKEYGSYLGIIVADIIKILSPQIVVFTGGLASAGKYFLPSLKKEVMRRTFPKIALSSSEYSYLSKTFRFYISSNPKNLGIIGAGIYALEKSNEKEPT